MAMLKQKGFSLVELGIVLVVVGLLLGTVITGLTSYIAQSKFTQAEKDLELIEAALLGYAISKGGLPCPDTDGYQGGPGAADGQEDLSGINCDDEYGYLPWADLGLKARDPWGNLYYYSVDTAYAKPDPVDSTVKFELTSPDGNIQIQDGADTASPNEVADNIVAVFFSVGPNGYLTEAESPSADEDENLDPDVRFVYKPYVAAGAAAAEFDDSVHWLSSFQLKNKMVAAQRLPE
ncbi:MAG TPA: prepilin-type N-terminal cleavage/methylation domain-containing protein [Gammaproteobacteria bacterium]